MSHASKNEGEEEDELGRLFEEFSQAKEDKDAARSQGLAMQVWAALARRMEEMPESATLAAWNEAHRSEAAFDWAGAEAAFRRAIRAEADEEEPAGRALRNLSRFYSFLGRDEAALRAARLATEQARRCPGPMLGIGLVQVLQGQAELELERGDVPAARALVEESQQVARDQGNEKLMEIPSLFGRLLLVDCALAEGDLDAVSEELDALWPLLEPWREAMVLTSWQAALASWWRTRARWWEAQGEDAGAVEAWREAVRYRRIVAQAPQLEGPYKINGLAYTLHSLGRALERAGDPLAAHAFAESRSLRKSVGLEEITRGS